MRYCPRCKTDIFGGSLCDLCGGRLVLKETKAGHKSVVHITQDMILGGPKHLKSELAQSMVGRIFRLVLEILLFCAAFFGVSWLGHVILNFLSVNMAMDPDTAKEPIHWGSSGVRYYLYVGWVIVTAITIKVRWQAGK